MLKMLMFKIYYKSWTVLKKNVSNIMLFIMESRGIGCLVDRALGHNNWLCVHLKNHK